MIKLLRKLLNTTDSCVVAPLFHWVATLGNLFIHIASPVSQLQETGVQKGVFGAYVVMVIKCARLN